MASPQKTPTNWAEAKEWMSKNKLKTVGIIWAGGLTASLAYQWTRPIPTSLKVIHSRVYAQALTLAALGGAAVADYLEHRDTTTNELELAKARIIDLEHKIEQKLFGDKK